MPAWGSPLIAVTAKTYRSVLMWHCSQLHVHVQGDFWRLNMEVLVAMPDASQAYGGSPGALWRLVALAQLLDLRVYHAEQAAILHAGDALLPGEAIFRVAVLHGSAAFLDHALRHIPIGWPS